MAKPSHARKLSDVAQPSAVIKNLADKIITMQAQGGSQITCAVGQLVFEVIFGRDQTLWHSKDKTKAQSLSELSQQPGMADAEWSYTRLHNAVGVYLLSKSLAGFRAYPHLQVSHFVAVLNLDATKQKSLLSRAEAGRWTVEQLKQAAGNKVAASGHGHSAQTEVAHFIKQLSAWEDPKTGLATALSSAGADASLVAQLEQGLSDLNALATKIDDQLNGKNQQKLHEIAMRIAKLGKKPAKARGAR